MLCLILDATVQLEDAARSFDRNLVLFVCLFVCFFDAFDTLDTLAFGTVTFRYARWSSLQRWGGRLAKLQLRNVCE